jgi:hypothetical protein
MDAARALAVRHRARGEEGLRWQPVSALRSFGKDRTAAPGSAAGRGSTGPSG